MPDKPYEDVEIEGHLIDSLMMPHIMDEVMDLDGEFEMLTFEVGRMKDDPSHAVMRIFGRDAAHLDEILTAITEFGVVAVKPQDAVLEAADMDGVFPERFYSTTNLTTFVRIGGEWIRVGHPEMDCGIRVDLEEGSAETVAMSDVGPATSSSPATGASACCRSSGRARASRSSSWPAPSAARSPRRRSSTRWRTSCARSRRRAG